jgi:transposase
MKIAAHIWLNDSDRSRLERVTKDRNSPQKHVWRARIVLLSAKGLGTMAITRLTGKSKPTVWRWQARYLEEDPHLLVSDMAARHERSSAKKITQ